MEREEKPVCAWFLCWGSACANVRLNGGYSLWNIVQVRRPGVCTTRALIKMIQCCELHLGTFQIFVLKIRQKKKQVWRFISHVSYSRHKWYLGKCTTAKTVEKYTGEEVFPSSQSQSRSEPVPILEQGLCVCSETGSWQLKCFDH